MSTIYGIINKSGVCIEQRAIGRIQTAIAHRVSDGKGLWQHQNAALGFCKLTCYPQQQNEQLPLQAGDLILVADARIDNRDELVKRLSLNKPDWPDSYLILKAYQKWGEQCLDYIQGDFVFAIWNKVTEKLFVATDQIGCRPLFYHNNSEQFIFCSEIKGVVAAKTTPNYFDEGHLIDYYFRVGDSARTYNAEVFALCGGNTLSWENSQVKIERYWSLQAKGRHSYKNDSDWIESMQALMYRAVEKRLNYDAPVGVTLSGGLDSTSVACILSELLLSKNKPLYAFSSVLSNDHGGIEQDEREYIKIVNEYCPNIIQTFIEAPGVGPFTNVEDAFEKDESIPNGFFYIDNAILRAAQKKNILNLFTGFGGDFLASWKGSSVIYLLMQQGKFRSAWYLMKALSKNTNKTFLRILMSNYLVYTRVWQQLRKLRDNTQPQDSSMLNPLLSNRHKHHFKSSLNPDHRAEMQEFVNSGRAGRIAGMLVNRNEWYRTATCDPFFDKDLLEFLIEVPVHLFLKNGYPRSMLRYAMDGVIPPEIQWRMDKLPYSPDFVKRVLQSKDELINLIDRCDQIPVFRKYFSFERIRGSVDGISPFAGFNSSTSGTSIRLLQTGIACKVLSHLKDLNYNIGE